MSVSIKKLNFCLPWGTFSGKLPAPTWPKSLVVLPHGTWFSKWFWKKQNKKKTWPQWKKKKKNAVTATACSPQFNKRAAQAVAPAVHSSLRGFMIPFVSGMQCVFAAVSSSSSSALCSCFMHRRFNSFVQWMCVINFGQAKEDSIPQGKKWPSLCSESGLWGVAHCFLMLWLRHGHERRDATGLETVTRLQSSEQKDQIPGQWLPSRGSRLPRLSMHPSTHRGRNGVLPAIQQRSNHIIIPFLDSTNNPVSPAIRRTWSLVIIILFPPPMLWINRRQRLY